MATTKPFDLKVYQQFKLSDACEALNDCASNLQTLYDCQNIISRVGLESIDVNTCNSTELTLKRIAKEIGIQKEVGLESFGDIVQTIKDKIKKILTWIGNFFKNLFKWLTDSKYRLLKRAKALKERIQKEQVNTNTDVTVEMVKLKKLIVSIKEEFKNKTVPMNDVLKIGDNKFDNMLDFEDKYNHFMSTQLSNLADTMKKSYEQIKTTNLKNSIEQDDGVNKFVNSYFNLINLYFDKLLEDLNNLATLKLEENKVISKDDRGETRDMLYVSNDLLFNKKVIFKIIRRIVNPEFKAPLKPTMFFILGTETLKDIGDLENNEILVKDKMELLTVLDSIILYIEKSSEMGKKSESVIKLVFKMFEQIGLVANDQSIFINDGDIKGLSSELLMISVGLATQITRVYAQLTNNIQSDLVLLSDELLKTVEKSATKFKINVDDIKHNQDFTVDDTKLLPHLA